MPQPIPGIVPAQEPKPILNHPLQLTDVMLEKLQELTGVSLQKTTTPGSTQDIQQWWNTILETLAKASREVVTSSASSLPTETIQEGRFWGQSLFALFSAFAKDLPHHIRQHLEMDCIQQAGLSNRINDILTESQHVYPGQILMKILDGARIAAELEAIKTGDIEEPFNLNQTSASMSNKDLAKKIVALQELIQELGTIPAGLTGVYSLTKDVVRYLKKQAANQKAFNLPQAIQQHAVSPTKSTGLEGGENFTLKDPLVYDDVMKEFTAQSRWVMYTQTFSTAFRSVMQYTECCRLVTETLVMMTLFYNSFGKALSQAIDFFQSSWIEQEGPPEKSACEKKLAKDLALDGELLERLVGSKVVPFAAVQTIVSNFFLAILEKGQKECEGIVNQLKTEWNPTAMSEHLSQIDHSIQECPGVHSSYKQQSHREIQNLKIHIRNLDGCVAELLATK
jgi:hypothetical protein